MYYFTPSFREAMDDQQQLPDDAFLRELWQAESTNVEILDL